ncbi:thioredoxin-dependent thiol peroxidase [Emticicia sp. BO119]|uniref:thioredoxin-dependent thiol peroxidase n=1 Tax=Emticicia sp. BO119 TaxID=2757768 RepID=UPI0015F05CFC|nr:thioredoxin-dependent thiol peroxidase [Emticicia sp. BO119]MBA4849077.1 thioredoxin-dependent thiol peroxidase [Emticicia sp. BO119]
MHLFVGNPVPEVKAKNQDGVEINLKDYKGKKVVLFFYPQDGSPTCTATACNLRDNYEALLAKGYKVFGISPDNEAKHQKFIHKYNLPFDLLSDPDHIVMEKFGIWAEKKLWGNIHMGVLRTTIIIDENGIIEEIITKVNSKNHAHQILK